VYYRVTFRQLQNGRNSVPSENGHQEATPQRAPNSDSGGKSQSATRKFVFTAWGDPVDRDLCCHALTEPPEQTPISGRTGLATAEWVVVDRRDGRALICNRLHDGRCDWPWSVETD
jgi:hypothetical protein